jgi:hypothetical protein
MLHRVAGQKPTVVSELLTASTIRAHPEFGQAKDSHLHIRRRENVTSRLQWVPWVLLSLGVKRAQERDADHSPPSLKRHLRRVVGSPYLYLRININVFYKDVLQHFKNYLFAVLQPSLVLVFTYWG